MESHALKRTSLVPIRVEFETDTLRIRDCFVWNMNDTLTKPETFAKIFCHDLDIPVHPWADTVTNQIRAQLEEHESVAALELGSDGAMDVDATLSNAEELSECRVILSVSLPNCHSLIYLYSLVDRCSDCQPPSYGPYRMGLTLSSHTGGFLSQIVRRARTDRGGRPPDRPRCT
jgi:hypothetical protein